MYYHAAALLRIGRYKEALVEVNGMLEAIPHHTNGYCLKGTILTRLEKYDEAIEHYKAVPVASDKTEIYNAGIGIAYAAKGEFSKAKEYLEKVEKEPQNLHLASEENAVVIINSYLGNFDRAFDEIEKDIKANKYYLNFYKENPAFKLLSEDPRHQIFDTIFKTKGTKNERLLDSDLLSDLSNETVAKKKAPLDEGVVTSSKTRLLELIETEEPYLNPDLSLRSLANQVAINPNQLSWLLNEHVGKNFNEFINHYRIEAFKKLASDPVNSNLTVMALAYDSGFNSKTVFNTYFKKETGITPKEFLKGQ
jgi:adenylate cyclase